MSHCTCPDTDATVTSFHHKKCMSKHEIPWRAEPAGDSGRLFHACVSKPFLHLGNKVNTPKETQHFSFFV